MSDLIRVTAYQNRVNDNGEMILVAESPAVAAKIQNVAVDLGFPHVPIQVIPKAFTNDDSSSRFTLSEISRRFSLADYEALELIVPANRIVDPTEIDSLPVRITDLQEFLRKTGKKSGTGELYEIIVPKKHRHLREVLAKIDLPKRRVK